MAEEGIDAPRLAQTAERLREEKTSARSFAALKWQDEGQLLQTAAGQETGILVLNPDWHLFCPIAIQRRLLSAMLRYVSGADYAPRAEALEDLRERLVSGGTGTLHGCDVMYRKGALLLFREYNSVAAQQEFITETTLWDGRWRVTDKGQYGRTLRALGQDGWEQAKGDNPVAVPHRAALSLPSIWQEDRLIACDGLDVGPGGTVSLAPKGAESPDFSRFLLSH